MHPLSIVTDSIERGRLLSTQLAEVFEPRLLDRNRDEDIRSARFLIIDIDLKCHSGFASLGQILKCRPHGSATVFIVDRDSRHEAIQAYALGATAIISRPIQGAVLMKSLLGDIEGLARQPIDLAGSVPKAVSSTINTLQGIFTSVCFGSALDGETIDRASDSVIADIKSAGLAPWIDCVRKHHSQTYQHCLLVAGTSVAFAQILGFSRADQERLSYAAIIHDVGKARIPLAILEKPGPLDADEMEIMRQHPVLGFEALKSGSKVPSEMMDLVLHHHEYLDGSGYPDGLRDREISDLVRILTISDIFGALMERRSYKTPLSAEAAYKIMTDMNGKLDLDLLGVFGAVAQVKVAQTG